MGAGGVKFIRKNGHVIPIRTGADQHMQQAKLGAILGAASAVAVHGLESGHNFGTGLGIGAAGLAVGAGLKGLYHQFDDSITHGKKQQSVLSGVGRFLTLGLANSAGQLGGGFGAAGGMHMASKIRVR